MSDSDQIVIGMSTNSILAGLATTSPISILHDFQKFRMLHRPFGKFRRKMIFILIFFINMVINFDHGAIPAATTTLKEELRITNYELGIIGSLVYLGLVIGALSAGYLFQNYSSKWIVIVALIMSSMFLYFFTITSSIFWISLTRVGCGYFQVFCLIYFPVWVDEYGVKDLRTYWLSFLQLGVPLGTMLGYLLEALFINADAVIVPLETAEEEFHNYDYSDSWKKAFYIQIMLLLILVVLLILTPDKFFSKNYKRSDINKELFEKEYSEQKTKEINSLPKKFLKKRGFKAIRKDNELTKYSRLSEYSIFSVVDQNEDNEGLTYLETLQELWVNKIYVFTLFGICCLLFIITGIQFWISDYMITILLVKKETVFISFSIVCITAPVLGVIYGGLMIQKIGGYTNPNAIVKCLQNAIIAACFGLLCPFVSKFSIFIIFIWLLLFFGASIVPGLTGIMLSSIGDYSKEVANSMTHLCYNLFGYLPSPFLYGLVCSLTGGSKSKWGLRFLMMFSLLGVLFLYLSKKEQMSENINNSKLTSLLNYYLEHLEEEEETEMTHQN